MPHELFHKAEATARRLQVSRSELYARAIAEFLTLEQGETITERLNKVYSLNPAKVDPALNRAQLKSLKKTLGRNGRSSRASSFGARI